MTVPYIATQETVDFLLLVFVIFTTEWQTMHRATGAMALHVRSSSLTVESIKARISSAYVTAGPCEMTAD